MPEILDANGERFKLMQDVAGRWCVYDSSLRDGREFAEPFSSKRAATEKAAVLNAAETMVGPLVLRPSIEEIAAAPDKFCPTCARQIATDEDWERYDDGEGEHLHWDTGACSDEGIVGVPLNDLRDVLAERDRYREALETHKSLEEAEQGPRTA